MVVSGVKTTGRTTPKSNVIDFDAEDKAANKPRKKKYQIKVYGKVWDLKRPNQALLGELEKNQNQLAALTDTLMAHVIETQRTDFLTAILADENLDIERVIRMTNRFAEIVYDDLPSEPSVSSG